MLSSTIYTIGTALTRAHDSEVPVDVLVDGQWIQGDVSAVDGHGVVLCCHDGGLAMIRVESIHAVLVRQAERFSGQQQATQPDTAHPMPAAEFDRASTSPTPATPAVRPRSAIENSWSRRSSTAT